MSTKHHISSKAIFGEGYTGMSVTEKVLLDLQEFDDIVGARSYRGWIYRGHSDASWKLESSLHRNFREIDVLGCHAGKVRNISRKGNEKVALEKFSANAHLYLNHLPPPHDILSWMALMQHHGAPTRLLDFTFSPYVAMYFALESGTEDAAIYSLRHEVIKEIDACYFKEDIEEVYMRILSKDDAEYSDDFLCVYEPPFANHRQMAQQGLFIVPSSIIKSHEEILKPYQLSDNEMMKYIIPKKLRREGLRKLQKLNITGYMLFPGLDGFCKSLRHQGLYPVRTQKRLGDITTLQGTAA